MNDVLSDELLESLIAAGQADVVVGLPTANHAGTVGPVARAVVEAFSGDLGRERTVLLNPDAGSTDGTRDVVHEAGAGKGDLIVARYALRTIHRISAPYHGLPGRAGALEVVFKAAELLRARAVVILDPTAVGTTAADVARWARAVLDAGADYVKPVVPRRPADGPLVTQLVRPLLRAVYGARLREPLDTQLAVSAGFVQSALAAELVSVRVDDAGLDVFLSAHAMRTKQRLTQVCTEAHGDPARARRPSTHEVFHQVAGALLTAVAPDAAAWASRRGSEDVPTVGHAARPMGVARTFATEAYARAFGEGVDALGPILERVVGARIHESLRLAARAPSPSLNDELWANVVYAFLRASADGVLSTDQLARALEPIYLGRVAAMSAELLPLDDAAGEASIEDVALAFERTKLATSADKEPTTT